MGFLYLLEKLRMPGLNELMLGITTLGEETAFLVIAMIMFWCVDKRRGYYVLSVAFLGIAVNQFLKLWFRIPRPWVIDEKFTILEQAREEASGYSFPSGHTQNACGMLGALAYTEKRKWLGWTCILLAILVGFSRMYIGVHTPADVLTSIAIASALILVLRPLILGKREDILPWLLLFLLLFSFGLLAFVEAHPFPEDVDAHNLESGVKNAYTLIGCSAGLLIVYVVDRRYLHFETKDCWWVQALKVLGGFVLVLAVKEGLRAPLEALCNGHMIARAIRYCILVLCAGILWPMAFPYIRKLERKKVHDNESCC